MIKIGKKPILMHILDTYLKYGFEEFYLALGYKKKIILDYFNSSNIFKKESQSFKKPYLGIFYNKKIKVYLVDTGNNTLTGGRLKRFKNLILDENFLLTYGDGLANVNIKKLLNFHFKHNKIATVTSVVPPARFGAMVINDNNLVTKFSEKNHISDNWINGGYFVFNKKIFKFLSDDNTVLEQKPLKKLASSSQLVAYRHKNFWQCMDTVRDREILQKLNKCNPKPWLI